MSTVKELIRVQDDAISFGDYERTEKAKLSDFPFKGDLYKVKTYNEITKLERNGLFVYESVPGTSVFDLRQDDQTLTFTVSGPEDAQITVGLEPETVYQVFLNSDSSGEIRTNLGGKLSFSVELGNNQDPVAVRIQKC